MLVIILKVESTWKNKPSNLALAASLNLDKLDESVELAKPAVKKKAPAELFKNFDEATQADHTFELNHIDRYVSRDAPDFVIRLIQLLTATISK